MIQEQLAIFAIHDIIEFNAGTILSCTYQDSENKEKDIIIISS
jgi:hypothetical protein